MLMTESRCNNRVSSETLKTIISSGAKFTWTDNVSGFDYHLLDILYKFAIKKPRGLLTVTVLILISINVIALTDLFSPIFTYLQWSVNRRSCAVASSVTLATQRRAASQIPLCPFSSSCPAMSAPRMSAMVPPLWLPLSVPSCSSSEWPAC